MRQPVSGVSRSPFEGVRAADMRPVSIGVPLHDLAPPAAGMLVCRVNGEWLLRESWGSLTLPGDVIEWYELPQDRDSLRSILQVAAIVGINFFFPGASAAFTVAANVAAQFAINALLPPVGPQQAQRPGQTADSFSSSLQGNEARLDQPIPRICGHKEINPPFAGQPYFEYRPREGEEDENLDNDQYFFALYAIGVGDYDVVAKIGNTPITRFADVLRADYLAPGVQPTDVLANVTTATEVSGQLLESGRYVGGFAACAARRTAAEIGIDVAATRGLGKGDDALTVSWRIEYREINDFGQVLGPWQTLGTETRTAYTSTPQRWSTRYELTSAARVEVRVVRTDVQDTDATALHELAWIGLRAYLDEPAPLNAETAHFEVVLRASSQLSQSASRDLRLITRGKCRGLTSGLTWTAEAYTRNWARWALDLVTSDTWGMRKPDERVDLQSFYELIVLADQRQDRFDFAFDSTINAWDALQLICRAGRARAFRRNGVISVARDGLAEASVTAFTPRNCIPGSMRLSETLRQTDSPDGVVVEYLDHRTGEWTPIVCPCPGVSEPANPVWKRLQGIAGATHAEREGLYEAAALLYRTRDAAWTTEMQGMLPAYLSPVDWVPDIVGYAQSGDVAFWDPATRVMGLTEPPNWDAGDLYLTLQRDDGTLTSPVLVTPGPTPYDVTLPAAPDFVLVLDDGLRERPKFMLGTLVGGWEVVKVQAIEDGGLTDDGAQLFSMRGLVDDDRVHEADNHLLPGPGDDQDPVGLPDDSDETGGEDVLVVPRILDFPVYAISTETGYSDDLVARVRFQNNGRLQVFTDQQFGGGSSFLSGQWNLYGEIETADAALYDVRATLLTSFDGGSPVTFTGTVGSWLNLATSRTWELTTGYVDAATDRNAIRILRFEIRETSTGIVQDSGVIDLRTFLDAGVGGG